MKFSKENTFLIFITFWSFARNKIHFILSAHLWPVGILSTPRSCGARFRQLRQVSWSLVRSWSRVKGAETNRTLPWFACLVQKNEKLKMKTGKLDEKTKEKTWWKFPKTNNHLTYMETSETHSHTTSVGPARSVKLVGESCIGLTITSRLMFSCSSLLWCLNWYLC